MKSHSWDMILMFPMQIMLIYHLFIRPSLTEINYEMADILATYLSCILSFWFVSKFYNKKKK
jgi:antibiotic biosynthesis monooxygenase (ABM) superfamily enzyme